MFLFIYLNMKLCASDLTLAPYPISINFTGQSYHHNEVSENFTETAGWVEEQNPAYALHRKLLKLSLYVLNKFTR